MSCLSYSIGCRETNDKVLTSAETKDFIGQTCTSAGVNSAEYFLLCFFNKLTWTFLEQKSVLGVKRLYIETCVTNLSVIGFGPDKLVVHLFVISGGCR